MEEIIRPSIEEDVEMAKNEMPKSKGKEFSVILLEDGRVYTNVQGLTPDEIIGYSIAPICDWILQSKIDRFKVKKRMIEIFWHILKEKGKEE